MRFKLLSSILVVFAFAALSACGGGSSKSTPPVIGVSVTPVTASVDGGATQQFTAAVSNSTNTAVTWTVTGGGSIDINGLYTAPTTVPTAGTATVTATSQADTTKSGTASANLVADAVTVLPTNAQIPASATMQFSATVTNVNQSVTWSVTGGGSIDQNGNYTAPAAIPAQATIMVTATSAADTAKSNTISATLLPDSITAQAINSTVLPGMTDQFVANVTNDATSAVTWSVVSGGGSIDANGSYTAPTSVAAPITVTVQAVLVSDPTQKSTATATVLKLQSLAITPKGATLAIGGTDTFSALGTFTDGTNLSTADWTPESTFTSSNIAVATVAGDTATALTTGVSTITATYAPSGVSPVTGSTALNVTAGTLSNSSLTGSYVFSLTHAGSRGQAFSAGVFIADGNGNITGGVEDFNAPQGSAKGVAINGGSYTVNPDGRGTLTFSAQGTDDFSFILSNDGSHGRLLLSDTTGVEVGSFQLQSATTLSFGTYSFLLGGMDGVVSGSSQNPLVVAGHFTVAGSTISNGELDVNDFGVINGGTTCGTPCMPPATALTFTANFAQPTANGRGTLTINPTGLPTTLLNNNSWNFDYFVVSASKIVLIQTDVQGAAPTTFAALTGTAEVQTFASGPTLSGDNFVLLLERSDAQGLFGTAGQWEFATTTALNGEMDANCLTTGCPDTTSTISISGSSYTIDASGRGTVTVGTLRSYVFYLIGDPTSNTARMYILETDNKSNAGVGQQQEISPAVPSGTLAFNLAQLATNGSDSSYLGQYDTTSLSGIADSNVAIHSVATPGSSEITASAFSSLDAFGRGTVTVNSLPNQTNTSYGFYVVNQTQIVVFGTSNGGASYQAVDGTFELQ